MVSDRAWKSKSIQLDEVDVDTGDASYALRDLALIDATGEGEGGDARLARLGTLELGRGGSRVVVEDLSAHSPAWREGMGGAQAIEAVSMTVDTVDRHRWQSSGWRLIGVATATSGRASADTASLENLVLDVADDSTVGAQRIELDGLIFDGESTVHAASAFAERTYFRASDGSGVDVPGLRADTVEWNGETLAAERGCGAADECRGNSGPCSVRYGRVHLGPARSRRDTPARSRDLRIGRGEVEHVLEWSAGALALGGYHAPTPDESMLDFAEARDIEIVGDANGARLRTDRVAARGARLDASGETLLANAEVDGLTLDDPRGRAGTSARALRASPLTIRESGLDIGTLSLSGIESAIGLSQNGDWELPALPIGPGEARSSFRVRIREASTADSDSVIRVVDRTTEPDFAASIDVTSATLRGLDHEAIGVPARFSSKRPRTSSPPAGRRRAGPHVDRYRFRPERDDSRTLATRSLAVLSTDTSAGPSRTGRPTWPSMPRFGPPTSKASPTSP